MKRGDKRGDNIRFEILWLDVRGGEIVVVGTDYVQRYDLTDAITAAANMLKGVKGESYHATGFVVRKAAGPG